MNLHWLEQLCALPGISGREDHVRRWLIEHLPEGVPYRIDPLGSLIVNPQSPGGSHGDAVMFCAHMDEVGLIVTDVDESGCLRFAHVGGIERAGYLGKQVFVGEAGIPGVVGLVPTHLLEDSEERSYPKQESLYIDIGALSKEEALQAAKPGDYAVFAPGFVRFGDGCIKSKAIDDRLGCAVLLELLHAHPALCAVFSAREEVGGAAGNAAFSLRPRYAIVLEATACADLPGVAGTERVCRLGGGVVVPFMDKGTVYPYDLYELAMGLAKQHGIPAQTKTLVAGATDAGSIHRAAGGVPTLGLAIPCRNLHSPSLVMKESDAQAMYALAGLLREELTQRC